MPTNFFFNNYQATGEQRLIEDLIIESIRIYGQDMMYIPRVTVALDQVFTEDALKQYTRAIPIEMYIRNVEGFAGQGDFLSKFNLQIRDQVTLTVARKSFSDEISSMMIDITRPREGDLIFFPLNAKIFEIKFVEHEAIFYQLGSLQTYDVRCELFEYSNEIFDTGIELIDRMTKTYSLDQNSEALLTEDGLALQTEDGMTLIREEWSIDDRDPTAQNIVIQTESDILTVWDEADPFAEGRF